MISHFKASIFHPSDPRITGCSHVRSRIQFWAHIEMLKHQLRGVSAKRFKSTIVSTYAPNWWRQWHFAELFTSHSNSFGESDPLLFWNIQQGGTIELFPLYYITTLTFFDPLRLVCLRSLWMALWPIQNIFVPLSNNNNQNNIPSLSSYKF